MVGSTVTPMNVGGRSEVVASSLVVCPASKNLLTAPISALRRHRDRNVSLLIRSVYPARRHLVADAHCCSEGNSRQLVSEEFVISVLIASQ